MATEGKTGTDNDTYNLISILYHMLQGAETYDRYRLDAEQSGDDELAGFIREVQEDDRKRAERAKKLLAGRVTKW